jgi:hypothetical protein
MKTHFQSLHEKALQIAKTYLRAESDLISILQAIDDCRGYRELGYRSLFDYSRQALGLSEAVSYNLITVARKAKEVPMLQEKLRSQEITLSNAKMIAPVLTSENQNQWLSAAASLSKRELEKEIAKEFPEKQIHEQARYVSEQRIELKLGISEELHQKLKRVQDLVSTQSGKAAGLEETLEAALALFIEKKDPVEKAHRAEVRVEKAKKLFPGQDSERSGPNLSSNPSFSLSPNPSKNPRFIPAWLTHAIWKRDNGQCTHHSSQGVRCSQRRWLEIHHIQPPGSGWKNPARKLATDLPRTPSGLTSSTFTSLIFI